MKHCIFKCLFRDHNHFRYSNRTVPLLWVLINDRFVDDHDDDDDDDDDDDGGGG